MTSTSIKHLAREVQALLERIKTLPDSFSDHKKRKLRNELEGVAIDLREHLDWLDPIKLPGAMFDPADPRLFGIFAAIALLGQDRTALDSLADTKFYGSGIYAIYYHGEFPQYSPIVQTENPIYVGVASPKLSVAKTPRDQGTKLADRLREHRKNILRAENLSIDDFTCRHLVVASGWEGKAESALINIFTPLWNKETKILFGFGKHGDSTETRGNKRSPWDVLHEGREWAKGAEGSHIKDQSTPSKIAESIYKHFAKHPPIVDLEQVLHNLLTQIKT